MKVTTGNDKVNSRNDTYKHLALALTAAAVLYLAHQSVRAQTPAVPTATQAFAAQTSSNSSTIRYTAANCANCHGTNGAGSIGLTSLAGLNRTYFVEQMAAFKSGARPETLMHQIAKGYSDEQIAAMSVFFEQQKK